MARITSISARVLYNSRGTETIEVDVTSDDRHVGRACAPSGASVGIHEATAFPECGAKESVKQILENASSLVGADAGDPKSVHEALRRIDGSEKWSGIGGAAAYAVTIAATESAAKSSDRNFFEVISGGEGLRFPYPLGNILGGGEHAGPGTPDIQEILVCPVGAKDVREAIVSNFEVHAELGRLLRERDTGFTRGRGDEGGWAPRLGNEEALELAARACERLGHTLGREVALGVDFAASTQWDASRGAYNYARAGEVHTGPEQIEFVSEIVKKYKLVYAEDAVHEEAFSEMAEITSRFPGTLVAGDDLTVTSAEILARAAKERACSAAILKVNQAGSLYDALRFAKSASEDGIALVTSHRSGESVDSHIAHIAIATRSKMLKAGVLGGERVAKLNELLRISEHGLIQGMADLGART